jgi:uncharacterized protein (TIGR02246 family)
VKGKNMATENRETNDEAQIRELIDRWLKSLRAKDLDGIMSCYAPDILLFDILPPLQYVGTDAYRKNWAKWFPTFQDSIGYEIRDLSVTTGDKVAFSHSLNRISGKRTDGEESDVRVRATVCYRKIDGKWMITHEHVSVPFYMRVRWLNPTEPCI